VRRRELPTPPAVRPPRELLDPLVEDWSEPGEVWTAKGGLSVAYRHPGEDEAAWRRRQVADHRYLEALAAFQAEHRGQRLDMTLAERRRWLLGEGPRWRRSPA